MSSTPSTARSTRPESAAGYTLIELLVGLLLSSVLLAGLVWEFGFTSRTQGEMSELVETQQGVRAALSVLTQELRQAGACLPRTGELVALAGTNNGTTDVLTMRVGKVRSSDLVCIRTVLTAAAAKDSSSLTVQDTTGFSIGDFVHVRGTSGSGEEFSVTSVGGGTLGLSANLQNDYANGCGVYAFQQRTYTVDNSVDPPILTVAVDAQAAQPLVQGVESFNVQYVTTPCPPCDVLNAPANDTDWLLVREVAVQVTVRSTYQNRSGQYVRLTSTTNVKPRNLL